MAFARLGPEEIGSEWVQLRLKRRPDEWWPQVTPGKVYVHTWQKERGSWVFHDDDHDSVSYSPESLSSDIALDIWEQLYPPPTVVVEKFIARLRSFSKRRKKP